MIDEFIKLQKQMPQPIALLLLRMHACTPGVTKLCEESNSLRLTKKLSLTAVDKNFPVVFKHFHSRAFVEGGGGQFCFLYTITLVFI